MTNVTGNPKTVQTNSQIEDKEKLLEQFVVNNPDLEELEDLLAEFNFFEVLNLQKHEIRHSNFLAWLLDPAGNHSLGEYFLRRFLWRTFSDVEDMESVGVRPLDFAIWDLSETQVFREKDRIDITLLNEKNKFVCAIENKLFTQEHDNQLTRYRRLLQEKYPKFKHHYVLLSVEGIRPEDENEQQCWLPISYGNVRELVDNVLRTKKGSLSGDVQTFLEHYATMLGRYILEDSQIQLLAKSIYGRHKGAIDLIFEYREDSVSQIREMVKQQLKVVPSVSHDHCSKSYIRFYPDEWEQFPDFHKSQGWTTSDRIILLEFTIRPNSLTLGLMLGPGDTTTRENIFSFAHEHPQIFKGVRANLTPRWTTLYRKNFLRTSDYEDADPETMPAKVKNQMDAFAKNDLPGIRESILELFRKSMVDSNE